MDLPPTVNRGIRPGPYTVSLATFLIFAAMTPTMYALYGESGGGLLMFSNAVVGYLCGTWAGTLAAVLNMGWYGVVISLAGGDALALTLFSGPAPYLAFLAGPAAGRVAWRRAQSIAKLDERERKLRFLTEHDTLTGLWTRAHFHAQVEQHLAEPGPPGRTGAMILINMDGFKYVNDSLGYQVGDQLLRQVAGLLRDLFGRAAYLARLSGDEFAVYLPGTDGATACVQAGELSELMRNCTLWVENQAVGVGASMGVAVYPDHGNNPPELLRKAYVAVFAVKKNGRNQVRLFRPNEERHTALAHKIAVEAMIRESLEYDRFVLHGQPILDLTTGRISHHELLLRMQRPDGRLIFPSDFIEVAERFGQIRSVDRWVATAAIRMAGRLPDHRFSVNLSARAMSDEDLIPLIRRELAENRVDPSRMIFEVTETAAIADLNQAARFVAVVRGLGCGFALDDFGAGFTSFTTLRKLPITHLKIDGSLIRGLSKDPINQRLVAAICEIAQALNMKTVPEFVDEEETLLCLRAYGADYAQGYFVGKPMPLE